MLVFCAHILRIQPYRFPCLAVHVLDNTRVAFLTLRACRADWALLACQALDALRPSFAGFSLFSLDSLRPCRANFTPRSLRACLTGSALRPLCALRLEPTAAEEAGVVDRSRLLDISGRGRKSQLALAEAYGVTEVPTPAGGCCLTEPESAARIWSVYRSRPEPTAEDFRLAGIGRQYWAGDRWLSVGRNESDNRRMQALAGPGDILFKTRNYPGPLALGRGGSGSWDPEAVRDAAAFVASFSPKAARVPGLVEVGLIRDGRQAQVQVLPARSTPLGWAEPDPEDLRRWKAGREAC